MNWIDGHLVLAALVSPVLALLLVGYANYRLRLRIAKRQQIFGGAR
jgi:hypothetical protein